MSKAIATKLVNFLVLLQQCIEQLWIVGLVVLCLAAIRAFSGLAGQSLAWAEYITLGFILFGGFCYQVTPALLNFLGKSINLPTQFVPLSKGVKCLLACAGLLTILTISLKDLTLEIAFAVLAQLSIGFSIYLNHIRKIKTSSNAALVSLGCFIFALALPGIWSLAFKFIWWRPYVEWLSEAPYRVLLFLLCLALVSANLLSENLPQKQPNQFNLSHWDAVSILLFLLMSLRTDSAFWHGAALHHWTAIVQPAQLVRQGGWLLWDVPSQYGFLNTLTMAFLPTENVWQSFYLLNALLQFLTAVFLFTILRLVRSGAAYTGFSFCFTLAAIFLFTGFPHNQLPGILPSPAVGPYRFFWPFALVAVLLGYYQSRQRENLQRPILIIGCACWLLGVLWSCESAIYCSVIWFPAYSLILLNTIKNPLPTSDPEQYRKIIHQQIRLFLRWFFLPFATLVGIVLLIIVYYLLRLGHFPDFRSYYEYCFAGTQGFFAFAMNPNGPVQTLLLIFCIAFIAISSCIRLDSDYRLSSVLFSVLAMFWITSSYYIGRSHDNNATSLSPMFCTMLAVILLLLSQTLKANHHTFWIKASLVPILTLILGVTFGNPTAFYQYLSAPQNGYPGINKMVPAMDKSLEKIFVDAGIQPTDSVLSLSFQYGNRWSEEKNQEGFSSNSVKAWLPLPPLGLYLPLSKSRVKRYMNRYIARTNAGGWLIEDSKNPDQTVQPQFQDLVALVYDKLKDTHIPTKEIKNGQWKLTYFQFVKSH